MILKRFYQILFLLCLIPSILLSTHTGNRYFLFLEKPENYVTKNHSFIDVSAFYSVSSTAYKRYGGTCGAPELYGAYDLKDVINSLQQVKPGSDPIYEVTGSHYLDGKSLPFHVTGKINTVGLVLSYEQNLRSIDFANITCGIWMPIMNSDVVSRFEFKKNTFQEKCNHSMNSFEVSQIDEIRRVTHKDIGFKGTNQSRGGVGDIDVHLRGNMNFDYVLMMRSIELNLQGGVIIPSGGKMDDAYPATIPFMNDNHWGIYLDFVSEFELKHDFKVGLILGELFQFSSTQVRNLSIGKEPTIYSALSGKVEIDPGSTFKFSPYLKLENLADGAHIQLRYTYLRHAMDKWTDKREDKAILSYLDTTPHAGLTKEELEQNLSDKLQLSKWRAHYFTIEAVYDSKLALKNWLMEPKIYATYDLPISGNGFCKTHQITLGAQFLF